MNHYFALLDAAGRSVATLPAPHHGTRVDEDGTISGQTGAMAVWNGPPPVWCWQIVEVRSEHAWESVPESEKTVVWSKL